MNLSGKRAFGALIAALLLAAGIAALASAQGSGDDGVAKVSTSGNHSERIKKLPITRQKDAERRVVMSLGPSRLSTLREGDRLEVSAEVQVTVNCDDPSRRCVGADPIYKYNPIGHAELLLTKGKGATNGDRLSGSKRFVCRQRLPNREHHCVIVFSEAGKSIRGTGSLPCEPDRCFVNLVLDAHHPDADNTDLLLIGGNRPDGSIPQDRGRVNAVVLRPGGADYPKPRTTRRRMRTKMKLDKKRRVIYSQRLNGLRKGAGIDADAVAFTSNDGLGYSTITAAQIILAEGPREAHSGNLAQRVVKGGEITESNGYNCTRNKPVCLTRKAGAAKVAATPRKDGRIRPMYVNLVMLAGPKRTTARRGDRQRVLDRGGLTVQQFKPEE